MKNQQQDVFGSNGFSPSLDAPKKNQQQSHPYTLNHPNQHQSTPAKGDVVRVKSADENFNYVQIGNAFLPVSFLTVIKRNLLDRTKFDPSVGVESIIEASFWQSLDDVMRGLVGPTVAYIDEHGEWIASLQREIAQRATNLGGRHD